MATFQIPFRAYASDSLEVEAETLEEAMDKAWDEFTEPYFPAGMKGDLSDWEIDEEYAQRLAKETE